MSTFSALLATLAVAAFAPFWPLQLAASVLGGLVFVRAFILFHDYMHGAILRDSRLAHALFAVLGCAMLVPMRSWRATHNHHHAHVGSSPSPGVGTFPQLTMDEWRAASPGKRLVYRITRHPLVLVTAYVSVFGLTVVLLPLLSSPRKHYDSAISVLVHAGIITALVFFAGWSGALFGFVLPFVLASALGAYLFYVQHNFVGARMLGESEWTIEKASLQSCSHLRLGPVMRWFTGDIGYHHVHHLNSRIPFYRLAEAMDAISAAQNPVVTTLHPKDVLACLRLKLWDAEAGAMVGFPRPDASTP